jgi:hypothetical protein
MITILKGSSTAVKTIPLQALGKIPWNYTVYSRPGLKLEIEGSYPLNLYHGVKEDQDDVEKQYREKIPGNEGINLMITDSRDIIKELNQFRRHGWKTQAVLIANELVDNKEIFDHVLVPFHKGIKLTSSYVLKDFKTSY